MQEVRPAGGPVAARGPEISAIRAVIGSIRELRRQPALVHFKSV